MAQLCGPVLGMVVVTVAAFCDVGKGKIFNWLTFPAIISGLLLQPVEALRGLWWGFLLFFLLWVFGFVGGGDLKLSMAVGSLAGAEFAALNAMTAMTILLFYNLILGLKNRSMAAWLKQNLAVVLLFLITRRRAEIKGQKVPLGLFLALGYPPAAVIAVWKGFIGG